MSHPTLQPPCCTSVGFMQLLHLGLEFELPNFDLIYVEYIAMYYFYLFMLNFPSFIEHVEGCQMA